MIYSDVETEDEEGAAAAEGKKIKCYGKDKVASKKKKNKYVEIHVY